MTNEFGYSPRDIFMRKTGIRFNFLNIESYD